MDTPIIVLGLLIVVSFPAGIFFSQWRTRRSDRTERRMPTYWPLDPRRMVNSDERKVWRWLERTFADHQVMVKMPVTRFTLPRPGEDSARLYQLLGGVYCTFTICRDDGQVVGCVDVPGHKGISRVNRQIKLTLLSQCGIAYWVVKAGDFPTAAEIRIEFLGEDAPPLVDRKWSEAVVSQAQQKLRSVVERRRHVRPGGTQDGHPDSGLDADAAGSLYDSGFARNAWQQPNSFVAPLDSRPASLH